MKGACDGGLNIPHSTKRFPGYKKEGDSYDANVHRERILGIHIDRYMQKLKEQSEDIYLKKFRLWD